VNDATPESDCDGFRPIGSAEFLQDVLYMVLHRLLRDEQLSCYLSVLFADRNLFENLYLATAQRFLSDRPPASTALKAFESWVLV
jgi:hypothetical protein